MVDLLGRRKIERSCMGIKSQPIFVQDVFRSNSEFQIPFACIYSLGHCFLLRQYHFRSSIGRGPALEVKNQKKPYHLLHPLGPLLSHRHRSNRLLVMFLAVRCHLQVPHCG